MSMNNKEYIFGRNPILEALRAKRPIEKIFIQHGAHGNNIDQIKFLTKQNGIVCSEITLQRLKEISEGIETQGIAALLSAKSYVELEDVLEIAKQKGEKPFILILDEIEDPQNLGAIIRTAECSGVHGIILPKHNSASLTSTVAKTSAGAIEHINIVKVTNVVSIIEELKKEGVWIVGTSDDASANYTEYDFNSPTAVIIGNEGKGIRKLVKKHCDVLLKIPIKGKITSLNASVSAGIILYEVVRQRIV
mgnify:CR=1 FL=1